MKGDRSMKTINLKVFYPWYTQDEFVEVSDEVAEELLAGKRIEQNYTRNIHRNKAYYSLDAGKGIETAAITHFTGDPQDLLLTKSSYRRLCMAFNSLPEAQGKRIEAHYILDISIKDIATMEGVSERSVRKAISRGLGAMKIILMDNQKQGTEISKNCPYI